VYWTEWLRVIGVNTYWTEWSDRVNNMCWIEWPDCVNNMYWTEWLRVIGLC